MGNTIEHVTQSLYSINSFHNKLDEIQESHESIEKLGRNGERPFNAKLFTMKLSKHFYEQIKRLEEKLAGIKKYFVYTVECEVQTK